LEAAWNSRIVVGDQTTTGERQCQTASAFMVP
jgi:hypothetical protein